MHQRAQRRDPSTGCEARTGRRVRRCPSWRGRPFTHRAASRCLCRSGQRPLTTHSWQESSWRLQTIPVQMPTTPLPKNVERSPALGSCRGRPARVVKPAGRTADRSAHHRLGRMGGPVAPSHTRRQVTHTHCNADAPNAAATAPSRRRAFSPAREALLARAERGRRPSKKGGGAGAPAHPPPHTSVAACCCQSCRPSVHRLRPP